MLIRNAEIDGRGLCDVRIAGDRITDVTPALQPRTEASAKTGDAAGTRGNQMAAVAPTTGRQFGPSRATDYVKKNFATDNDAERTIDADGAALLPGLHDHHAHLLALAAANDSVRCGPPDVSNERELTRALTEHRPDDAERWLRGIGYHESVAGDLDRNALDRIVPDHPVRIQHRSGIMWAVNSRAAEILGLDAGINRSVTGIERGTDGRATGRLFRLDGWLRERLNESSTNKLRGGLGKSVDETPFHDLTRLGHRLASFGVVGVTDATASNDESTLDIFCAAVAARALPQRLMIMGTVDLPAPRQDRVVRGAVKIILDEHALPALADLVAIIGDAHDRGRAVAIHCVTRATLVLAVTALQTAGCSSVDRIEHASVAPPEVISLLAGVGGTVVTQPGFIRERGDTYLRDVEADDRQWLYRCRSFIDSGVLLAAGTDAPFGDPDPWRAMQAAVDRRSQRGLVLGASEALSPEQALTLFATRPDAPGGATRGIVAGQPADLCLLDRPWSRARTDLSSRHVRMTIGAGRVIWERRFAHDRAASPRKPTIDTAGRPGQ